MGAERLGMANIPEAELDARLLLEYVCGTTRHDLLVHGDREVDNAMIDKYNEMLTRRENRIPLQHITGSQEFMGLNFVVNEHVLIPRQDTEILVEQAWKSAKGEKRILDMCTGSGCILISLLHLLPQCSGVGVDISKDALTVAKKNGESILQDKEQIQWIESDLFTNVQGEFDIIVSNPPYIRTKVIEELMPEVKEHEPILALDGLEDGLYYYKRITEEASGYLKAGGMIFYEIGYDQAEDVSTLLKSNGYTEIEVIRDYAGLDRVVCGKRRA